jgi:hypothetical protein
MEGFDMMKRIRQGLLAMTAMIVVTLGVVAWDTRPIAAQEPPMDPSYGAWCERIHAELFATLPDSVRATLVAMHEHHGR